METWEELPGVSSVPTNSKAPQEKMSAQDSCLSLIKYLLFVFNLFFFVLGSLIFCFGIWILIDKTSFMSFVEPWQLLHPAEGFSLTSPLCPPQYFGTLLLLFATQITVGILISTQKVQLERKVEDVVLKTIQTYRAHPEETAAEESWDYVQFQLRCCGWNSPQDWFRIPSLRSNESRGHRVPCSCYNSSATNDSAIFDKISFPQFSRLGPLARPRHNADICLVAANSYIYREGCARSLQKWLHNNLISIVGICLGVGLLELSFMTLSIFLCRNLDHVYDRLARWSQPLSPHSPRGPRCLPDPLLSPLPWDLGFPATSFLPLETPNFLASSVCLPPPTRLFLAQTPNKSPVFW
ncbi:leukocyte antigen CD37 isoform X2 [Kogia breviceps]|uniref:leukocyte antigen CD37 isoform X2 n=1 Tax=Kogia breviceps TaxID=27615 RepID=UPI0034D2D3D9